VLRLAGGRRAAALLLLGALALFSSPGASSLHGEEEVLIEVGDLWKYHKGTQVPSTPVTAWRELGFDDSAWLEGPTGIGYADGDDATVLSDMQNGYISVFLRKVFTVADPASVDELLFILDWDDGFVAHLNNVEVARDRVNGNPVPFNASATSGRESGAPEDFFLDPALLLPGDNVFTIQVHNQTLASSDLTCIPTLVADPDLKLTRGPYLQLGGPTTMTIAWQTNLAETGLVEHGTTPELGERKPGPLTPSKSFAVTLSSLQPDMLHHYRVVAGGQVLADGLTFRTFPPPGTRAPFRLAAWGDSGSGTQPQYNVAARIALLQPDLAIHAGDLVYENGEAQNFNPRWFRPYADIVSRILIYPSLGNHDVLTASGQPYLDAFYLPANNPLRTEKYYSFDYGDVHFIALDTNQSVLTGSDQHRWLQSDLETMGGFWTVVFFHHSPYTTAADNVGLQINTDLRTHVGPLFDRHAVDLVVASHTHAFERYYPVRADRVVAPDPGPDYTDPGGTLFVTTGGGGDTVDSTRNLTHPNNAFSFIWHSEFHAVFFDFEESTISAQAVKHDGVVLDRFSLTKTPDTTPPVVSEPSLSGVTWSVATIGWTTDEVADSRIEWGPAVSFSQAKAASARVRSHAMTISGLLPESEVSYRVISRDRSGNEASVERTFTTLERYRLELDAPAAVERGEVFAVSLRGTTFLPAAAFRTSVVYDREKLEFIGSAPSAFTSTQWRDAPHLLVEADGEAGRILIEAAGDEAGPEVGPAINALFAALFFRAPECTGPLAFDFDPAAPSSLRLVGGAEGEGPAPHEISGETTVVAIETFLRGNVNGSAVDPERALAAIDVADPIYLLEFLYREGPLPPCLEAADATADGTLDLGDAVFLIQHLAGLPAAASLPPPWPELGPGTGSRLSCQTPPPSACGG
jgi:hypothetical protein